MRLVPKPSLHPVTLFTAIGAAMIALLGAHSARSEALVVPLDHSTRLQIAGAAQSVVVGNPMVADVTVVDSHTLFVSGRGYGVTDIFVLDGSGHTIYSNEVLVGLAHTGRVSVWRGSGRTDMACSPNCQVSIRTGGGSGGSVSGPSPAAAPASASTSPQPSLPTAE